MSSPPPAIRTWAAWVWTPGIVDGSSTTMLVRGERQFDAVAEVLDRGVERVDVREQLRDHDPWCSICKRLASASRNCGIFRRIRAFAGSASCAESLTPASNASSIARADLE